MFKEGAEEFFGCAVYRNASLCPYKVVVPKKGEPQFEDAPPLRFHYGYGLSRKL